MENGRLAVWFPKANIAVTRIEGTLTSEIADQFTALLEPLIRKGKFIGLHDWTAVTGFDVVVPPRLAAWTIARLDKVERIVIATEHPFVAMAVRATNLTIKRIEHVESRAAFVTMMNAALGRVT